jgi:hypothetical protein
MRRLTLSLENNVLSDASVRHGGVSGPWDFPPYPAGIDWLFVLCPAVTAQEEFVMTARKETNAPWVTAMAEHEGFPLALRVRPAADSPANRARYPRVALVSHALSDVTENGLPEAAYNDELADFDQDLHTCIERGGDGLVALVETFAGKRNYYAYVADDARLKVRVDELRAKYPQHSLSVRGGADPEWKVFNDYRRRFPW